MGLAEWPEFRPGELLRALVAEGVDFVVIGGLAAVLHGSAAITRDLDITYAPDADNLERLGRTMVTLGARLRGVTDDVPFVPDGRTLRGTRVLTLATPDGSIDLLAQPDGGPPFARLRERAWRAELAGTQVWVASLEDLIAMKKAAGRPKDLVAVEELEAIQRLQREMT
ncbi:MAG TPA: nucleotidyl transferase AbiEii/AbiGii toxin family protein [Solirubrobacteraceae bacterium]|nr:nucleotidyl transferase AbiEii/AbiGii toxin family protein [Solirubrobacteraceae bacterium]